MERKIQKISKKIYDDLETEAFFIGKPDPNDIKKYVSVRITEMKRTVVYLTDQIQTKYLFQWI